MTLRNRLEHVKSVVRNAREDDGAESFFIRYNADAIDDVADHCARLLACLETAFSPRSDSTTRWDWRQQCAAYLRVLDRHDLAEWVEKLEIE